LNPTTPLTFIEHFPGATANKPLFGATPATTAPATTTFGGFGATQQPAQQNQATGTGLFGTGGGLFGQQQNQQQQQQQPAAGTGCESLISAPYQR